MTDRENIPTNYPITNDLVTQAHFLQLTDVVISSKKSIKEESLKFKDKVLEQVTKRP